MLWLKKMTETWLPTPFHFRVSATALLLRAKYSEVRGKDAARNHHHHHQHSTYPKDPGSARRKRVFRGAPSRLSLRASWKPVPRPGTPGRSVSCSAFATERDNANVSSVVRNRPTCLYVFVNYDGPFDRRVVPVYTAKLVKLKL